MSSDLFMIGASGTRNYQAAIGAVADNIANANTEGYVRRTILLRESPASNSTTLFYRANVSFSGVSIDQVTRYTDQYLDAAARLTTSSLGSADQRARWMNDVQTALNDNELGVGKRLSAMFSAVERLAANPTDTTLRANVIFSFEQINTAFKQSHDELLTIRSSISSAATNEVQGLNDALQQLATANEGLRRTQAGSAAHVSLLDSRDQALTAISKRLNVSIDFGANDVANVRYGANDLVKDNVAGTVKLNVAADGTLSYTLNGIGSTGTDPIPDPTNGTLHGLTKSAEVNRDRVDTINDLAAQYVADVNQWHSQGVTPANTAGQPVLSIGADAGTIGLLLTDPSEVAAAAGGVSNGNLLAINSIRGSGSVEEGWTGMIAAHGNLVAATLAEQTASASRDSMAQQARSDVSGVNLDREAADLLRLQQAYQGSARIIQVAKELMDTIFSIL